MATPSGQIGMSDVNAELGASPTAVRTLNDTATRALAAVPTGAITMDNLRGKSALDGTGGTITTISGYKTHTFNASATFALTKNAKVSPATLEYLLVGGGGAGGKATDRTGGGGGGGGVLTGTFVVGPQTLLPSVPVTVGAGGDGSLPSDGNRSQINWPPGIPAHVYAWNGGRGGGDGVPNGANSSHLTPGGGGSGGGGQHGGTGGTSSGSGGTPGGNGINPGASPGPFGGGGGGGEGASGVSAGPGAAGPGGLGQPQFGLDRSGGGGGAAQRGPTNPTYTNGTGFGGGGNGALGTPTVGPVNGSAGVANRGGGGGGGAQLWPAPGTPPPSHGFGGNGGSGIAIIRYLV